MLTLYPAILPNSFIRSSSFFGEVYKIFHVHYHVICKQWQFCFLLSNLDAFYLFFLSDCCGRTSNTMLNRSGERWHPCLVPDLSGKALSFCPLSRSLIYGLYYVEECSLYSHFAECFYHKWVLYFIKCFFPIH